MSKIKPKAIRQYELTLSPLYKLSNKKELAALLGIPRAKIANLDSSGLCTQYNIFKDFKTHRVITEPKDQLADVHKRLLKLLTRITPPPYIHSAIKKRSYKTNAEQHTGNNVLKIDIRKFFPSVKFHHIHNFFLNVLCCSPDIATILTKLCTVQTIKYGVHLPTGSCISPILSFWANSGLFESINQLATQHNCTFTLYVDDITISGDNATRSLLTQVAMEIHKHGYSYHKIKTYHGSPAMITGLIVDNGKLHLPHERAKKIREYKEALDVATNRTLIQKLLASLIGRLSEAEQINPAYKNLRKETLSKFSNDWNAITLYRLAKSQRTRQQKRRATNRA